MNVRQPVLIASTTKTFMAATILRLAENGKLNINQNIKDLIAETSKMQLTKAGYNLDSITIRHLFLIHRESEIMLMRVISLLSMKINNIIGQEQSKLKELRNWDNL